MTEHILKLNDRYFDAVKNGIKTFEIRYNDRGFRVGDMLLLRRCNDQGVCERYADHSLGINVYDEVRCAITYIITHDEFPQGINEGYCVMSIKIQ